MKYNRRTKPNTKRIDVGLIMGSISDYPLLEETEKILKILSIPFHTTVASAHRTPDLVREFVISSEKLGAKVFIAAAGGAAALPGVVAAETLKPVIGVPVSSTLSGLDSLLSMVQMPGGIPVATVAVGKAGAKNAALLAAQILALSDQKLAESLKKFRLDQRQNVIEDAKKLETNA